MCDSSSLIMGPIYDPDANSDFYWKGGDSESFKQLWGNEIVCSSEINEGFSFGHCMCRLKEY